MTDESNESKSELYVPEPTLINRIITALLVIFARTVEFLLTRTTVEGQENIPKDGPAIFVANHASTWDALMMKMHTPRQAFFVGPGDFKLMLGGTWLLRNAGVILTNRGAVDRESLKIMGNVLKRGGMLALFPEGGTWEKTIEDVKPGAAYLSYQTGASIVPMAFGGTYRVWFDILHFKRPRISIKIGKPIPAVTTSGDRKTRQQELQDFSIDLMKQIYEMLPRADQELYDLVARQRFTGKLEKHGNQTIEGGDDFSGIAELVSKPNLFTPLQVNTTAPLDAISTQRGNFAPASEMNLAASTLKTMFEGPFKGYLEYRLGDEKSQKIYNELDQMVTITQHAAQDGATLRFVTAVSLQDQ